jgi:hypothetical protein
MIESKGKQILERAESNSSCKGFKGPERLFCLLRGKRLGDLEGRLQYTSKQMAFLESS